MSNIFGFDIKVCEAVPKDEVWFVQYGEITGKIINIGAAAQKAEESGGTKYNSRVMKYGLAPLEKYRT